MEDLKSIIISNDYKPNICKLCIFTHI